MPKNVMDDKKLNFNQPLLSVRRGSSATAVPEVDRRKTTRPSHAVPRLPYHKSELKSGPLRNPGVVPFKWEQIPGRPKDERKLQNGAHEKISDGPKLAPWRPMNDENSWDAHVQECVGSKAQLENDGTGVSDSSSLYKNVGEENGSMISDGESSIYVDAPDGLSRTESFFLNCSLTGVSGLDGPTAKPDGAFSDPLARDLMMGRFLPAAKAVACETPRFGSKKQPVAKEQPREAMKVVALDKHNTRYCYTPDALPQHPQDEDEGEDTETEDEEDGDNDFGGNDNVSVRLCGLLPRFCLLNPVPGMRDQVPRPLSSFKVHKKPTKGAFNKTDKAIRDAIYERRRLAVYKRSDMRIEADRLKNELNNLYPQNNLVKVSEEISDTVPGSKEWCNSLSTKERQFLGMPEATKDSKFTSSQRKAYTKSPKLLAAEKTLYIDSAQITEYRDSNSSSSESRSMTESRGRNPSVDYSVHDVKDSICADNMPSQSPNMEFQDHKPDSVNQLPDADLLLPLPLPKSPSESWLTRALPSVSSRNPRSYYSTANLGFRSPPIDPKWSSKLHYQNFGLPELTSISET